jgi:SagB-type dehydrogenase family enzyme
MLLRQVEIATFFLAGALGMSGVALPPPRRDSDYPLERALAERRSVREFDAAALGLTDLGQLAWAAQGERGPGGHRTAPSAGALYPLELFVAVGNIEGLAPGIYRYEPSAHRLAPVAEGDRRSQLADAALGQRWLAQAPAVFIIAGVERRIRAKYGERGERFMHIEAGHAAQNLLLQAVALGLGSTPVGAFSDAQLRSAAALPREAEPLYLLPVGKPR